MLLLDIYNKSNKNILQKLNIIKKYISNSVFMF